MENKSLTENGAISYKTTCSNLLDLFIMSVRNTSKEYIFEKLKKCWNENSELTVKLIYLTRDIRKGKGEKQISFYMLDFLRYYFIDTYKLNIKNISCNFGKIKDLLEMADTNLIDNLELEILSNILLEDLDKPKPSLAVKWAPRESNKYKHLVKSLSQILFPNNKKSLELYRKTILNPLSQKVIILEKQMCQNQWNEIQYNTVPAQAMKIYGRDISRIYNKKNIIYQSGAFKRHDTERFSEYLGDVKKGTEKINTTGIQPHQLVKQILLHDDETINLQWNTLVDNLRNTTSIKSSIAVVDVSGSMQGEPIEVALALGLIISEISLFPFNNKIITFSNEPVLHQIIGYNLYEKISNISNTDWHTSTNIEKVFDLILNSALIHGISNENLIKNIFIFTDMQFNEASKCYINQSEYSDCDTNYSEASDCATNQSEKTLFKNIKEKYITANYTMPKLIFWNLRNSNEAFPIDCNENGYVYLSGFSAELLKIFMNGLDFNPLTILESLLAKYDIDINDNDKNYIFNI